ncbi:MAG: beta-lactamase domain protein [Acidimicrobiaceae bacterium]|jgi:N-acyl homoserine lactone hydrolase|nr:beta-lactamase domain protein [Acidimicrobiaceae bacterium]
MRMYVMRLGYCDVDKGQILTPGIGDGVHMLIPILSFLVETDDGARVLIDTGMHPVHIEDPEHTFGNGELNEILRPVMTENDTLEYRLREIGLTPGDITHVANSHLHFDHCGQNFLFPDVPIYVDRRHFAAARTSPSFPAEYIDAPGLRYELTDGEHEIVPRVRTLASPGHVPAHQSFAVALSESTSFVIASDAIYTKDNIEFDAWGSQDDPELAKVSAHRLRDIAVADDSTLVYGHDPDQWRELRLSPDYYE